MSNKEARRLFRQRVRAALKRADEAFKGDYKAEIEGLLGLSKGEIDAITPGNADLEAYNQLIAVVKEASRVNLAQAELRERILSLGNVAVEIAGKVPSLGTLLR